MIFRKDYKMLTLYDVLQKNIKIPTPRGHFTDDEKKQIFASRIGWVKINENGRSEVLFALRNLDRKLQDYCENQIVKLDGNQITSLKNTNNINISDLETKEESTKFDFVELEDGIENKKLKKGNLIRFYLVWTDSINIKANDGLKTYIQVYNEKDKLLGNAYYRERVNEKTLMFVYKIGKEKINNIVKVNPTIIDGRIKDSKGELIISPDNLINLEGVCANMEGE